MATTNKKNSTIIIPDNFSGYPASQHNIPLHYREYIDRVLITNNQIVERANSLAYEVHTDYKGKKLHIICVLKGGINTFSDFISQLIKLNSISTHSVPLTYDFIRITSYENMHSSGKITIESTLKEEDVKGKDILIIEDIVDTAQTIIAFTEKVSTYNPNSMKVLSELVKRLPKPVGFSPDYVGFSIPDEFVIGYGLDYNQIGRDIQDICILNDKGKAKFKK